MGNYSTTIDHSRNESTQCLFGLSFRRIACPTRRVVLRSEIVLTLPLRGIHARLAGEAGSDLPVNHSLRSGSGLHVRLKVNPHHSRFFSGYAHLGANG